jgi:2-polyprenyl-6-hydroxyphenyl methylase/3-demethylubiquinone-9 3-methyltransferase
MMAGEQMQGVGGSGSTPEELAKFNAVAGRWWDQDGPMRALMAMNPVRTDWIMERVRPRFGAGVRVLDVGCGAGLLAESLARAGCVVTGLDAAAETIAAAQAHAAQSGMAIDYQVGTAGDLAARGAKFPVVTALEIIEHVEQPERFIAALSGLVEPSGMLFISTINRTRRSFLGAKLGAEYLLRLVPAGTHDWRKFVTPSELSGWARDAGLRLGGIAGMTPEAGLRRFRVSASLAINYIALFEKGGLEKGGD